MAHVLEEVALVTVILVVVLQLTAIPVSAHLLGRSIYRQVGSGGSFGGSPLRQTIGLGRAERIERVEVLWPRTGATQVVTCRGPARARRG